MHDANFDLEERLLECAARIIRLAEQMSRSAAALHVAQQLLRSGTSPWPNHGEAQAAESPAGFIHKPKVGRKKWRETFRWLRLVRRVPLVKKPERVEPLLQETDELIRIFVSSIKTSPSRRPAQESPVTTSFFQNSMFDVGRSLFGCTR